MRSSSLTDFYDTALCCNRSMLRKMAVTILVLLTGLTLPWFDVAQTRRRHDRRNVPPTPVAFCELARHPEKYVNHVVRTSAIFVQYFPDVWFMYDPRCSDRKNRMTDYLECKTNSHCDRLRRLSNY